MASNIIWIVIMLDIASQCSRKQLSWGVCHHSGSWWENMLLCDEPTLKSPPKVHFDGMCVATLHCETVVHWDGWEIWHWHRWWLHQPPLPHQKTAHCVVCLSLLSTHRVGSNVGWHSDTLADVFWHFEEPSCAFTYAMTQISIPPHTPSTLIRAAS